MTTTARQLTGLVVAVAGTLALLTLTLGIGQQAHKDLGRYFLYQAVALLVAVAVVVTVRFVTGAPPPRWGDLSAPSRRSRFLGVSEGESWRRVGVTFTAVFLGVSYADQHADTTWSAWGLALLIALPLSTTNALTEELITRWAVVASLTGRWAAAAPWASALIFGSVHWFGIPGGPVGAVMAGFLGWLLARSIQDTRGIGWAWIVHFCQDVLIFTVTIALFL